MDAFGVGDFNEAVIIGVDDYKVAQETGSVIYAQSAVDGLEACGSEEGAVEDAVGGKFKCLVGSLEGLYLAVIEAVCHGIFSTNVGLPCGVDGKDRSFILCRLLLRCACIGHCGSGCA